MVMPAASNFRQANDDPPSKTWIVERLAAWDLDLASGRSQGMPCIKGERFGVEELPGWLEKKPEDSTNIY